MKLIIPILISQVGIDDVLGNGATTARSISEGWDKQWLDLLQNNITNNLYGALTNLGIFFAVGTLLFFMLQWLKDVINSEYSRPISDLIWPLIVVALLANSGSGSMLSSLTLGVRNFLNTVNQEIITTTDADKVYQQALNMSIAEDIAGSVLRPCQSLTGEQQSQCFVRGSEKITLLWQEYRNLYGSQAWIDRLENKVNQIAYNTGNVSESSFNSLLGTTVQTIIKSFLVSLQYAFQNLIEVTMLLIATLGPLAVGGSLLPVAGKPIFAWLTGFVAIGISKISFNIVAMLTSAVIVNGPGQDASTDPDLMWFMIFLGILAPSISLLVAALGGFAVFNAISNTASWVKERV
ncbi:hypothetical protein [Calothrix sp. PCC 6303]|uniref:hypothetical protein n=1 Tax=Calothrix sp. PCC 6303 TaxID=1170562 RepID=UPI0002A01749|nr:hypothetical protein [Calothrix sp. PCC 6303]AFZ02059.1 hypothetical protein Cal6303_3114 [Calothrix sp. PCC 6303]